MIFLRTCQSLFLQFYKAELGAVFLLKRSEILTWYRCLYHKTEHHKCQQLASLLAASEKQPNSWRLNKSPTAQVDPSRSGLKRIQRPCREICSTSVTPFIMLLWLVTQMALKNCNTMEIWRLGTLNIRSLLNTNYFVRYDWHDNLSTTQQ